MDSESKSKFSRYFIGGTLSELKSTFTLLSSELRTLNVKTWAKLYPLAKLCVILIEMVSEIAITPTVVVRPRRGSLAPYQIINDLRNHLDKRIRGACQQLDELSTNINTISEEHFDKVGSLLTKIKEVSMEYVFLFTLDIKDERPVEEIIAEMTTFLSMLRDAEAAKRKIWPQLLDELHGIEKPQPVIHDTLPKQSRSTPGSLSNAGSSVVQSGGGTTKSKSAPPSPRGHSSATVESRHPPPTSLESNKNKVDGASLQSPTDSSGSGVKPTHSKKTSDKIASFVSGLLKKVSKSMSKGSDTTSQRATNSPRSASASSALASATTTALSTHHTSTSKAVNAANASPRPPDVANSSEETSSGGGVVDANSSSKSASTTIHSEPQQNTPQAVTQQSTTGDGPAPPPTPNNSEHLPVTPPVSRANRPSDSASELQSIASAPNLLSKPGPINVRLASQAASDIQREEEMQRSVINKFNLEGRILPNNPPGISIPQLGNRAKRKAGVFTRAVDRYSQLYSNTELSEEQAKIDAQDAVDIYEEPEEGNLKLEQTENGNIEVAAGTLNQLVKYLTSEKMLDGKFVQTFLLTYTSFTTPSMLLNKLFQRYNVPLPQPSSEPGEPNCAAQTSISAADFESERRKLQLRVVNTLKKWLDMCFLDFNDELIGKVFEFIDMLKSDGHASLASILDNVLLTKLVGISKKKEFHHETPPPPPIIPKVPAESMAFEHIDPLELARQMTLLDHEVYTQIRSSELLSQSWNKPHLKHRSPRVLEMIHRFNLVSHWVAGVIVRVENLKERARTMERFITLAQHLRELQNFNSLMAILSGLSNSAVFRLAMTKEEISKSAEKTWTKLTTLMSSHQNFANYKEELKKCSPPAVPYLGIYLTNLTFIEDGNPDMVNGLINFKKRKLVSKIIVEIQKYQEGKKYNFVKVDSIVDFLESLPDEEDDELYALSLLREPRVAKK